MEELGKLPIIFIWGFPVFLGEKMKRNISIVALVLCLVVNVGSQDIFGAKKEANTKVQATTQATTAKEKILESPEDIQQQESNKKQIITKGIDEKYRHFIFDEDFAKRTTNKNQKENQERKQALEQIIANKGKKQQEVNETMKQMAIFSQKNYLTNVEDVEVDRTYPVLKAFIVIVIVGILSLFSFGCAKKYVIWRREHMKERGGK